MLSPTDAECKSLSGSALELLPVLVVPLLGLEPLPILILTVVPLPELEVVPFPVPLPLPILKVALLCELEVMPLPKLDVMSFAEVEVASLALPLFAGSLLGFKHRWSHFACFYKYSSSLYSSTRLHLDHVEIRQDCTIKIMQIFSTYRRKVSLILNYSCSFAQSLIVSTPSHVWQLDLATSIGLAGSTISCLSLFLYSIHAVFPTLTPS